PCGVPPDEERLAGLVLLLHEGQSPRGDLLVDRLHPLPGERAGVLDLPARDGMDHAPRAELLPELLPLRIVDTLRLLLGVEMVEVAEELVETVGGREKFVAVAEMVLPELPRRVAQGLQQLSDRRVVRAQSDIGPGQAHFGQAGADRRLSRDEG